MRMKPADYIKDAIRTESRRWLSIAETDARVLHGAMGLCTEAGELLDAVKKYLFYDKSPDKVNMKEEIGDAFWYLAVICDALDISFEECWERNLAKLRQRYGDRFSSESACNRDLAAERKELEK